MHDRPSLRSRERWVDLLKKVEYRLDEVRLLHMIEADAQSASFDPEGHVRLF
jgi:hypothetical protein